MCVQSTSLKSAGDTVEKFPNTGRKALSGVILAQGSVNEFFGDAV